MTSFEFKHRDSWVEKFDPRAQIVFYVSITTGVLLVSDWRLLTALCVITAAIALSARLVWRETIPAWRWLLVFVIVSALPNLVSRYCIECAAVCALRLFAIFLPTIVIVRTLDPSAYGIASHGLGLPDKPAIMLSLMMRFVPTLIHDFESTSDAQRTRGLELDNPKRGFIRRVRLLAPLLVPVIVRSLVESIDVANAMDLRAFGMKRRTWLRELHYCARDRAAIATGIGLLAACVAVAFLTRA